MSQTKKGKHCMIPFRYGQKKGECIKTEKVEVTRDSGKEGQSITEYGYRV